VRVKALATDSTLPLPERLHRVCSEFPVLTWLLNAVTPVTLLVLLGTELRHRIVNINTGVLVLISNIVNFRRTPLYWPLALLVTVQAVLLAAKGHWARDDFSQLFVVGVLVNQAVLALLWWLQRRTPAPSLSVPGLVLNHAIMTVTVLYQWMVVQNNRALPCVSYNYGHYPPLAEPCCPGMPGNLAASCIEDGWMMEGVADVAALYLLLFKNVNFLMTQTRLRMPPRTRMAMWLLLAFSAVVFFRLTVAGMDYTLAHALVVALVAFVDLFLADGTPGLLGLLGGAAVDASEAASVQQEGADGSLYDGNGDI
jgi:hypothetical protein